MCIYMWRLFYIKITVLQIEPWWQFMRPKTACERKDNNSFEEFRRFAPASQDDIKTSDSRVHLTGILSRWL